MKIQGGYGKSWECRLYLRGDKSLSHRALILASMAVGSSTLTGVSRGADVASTSSCLVLLGAKLNFDGYGNTYVEGWGKRGPREPVGVLDCGNSGTTLRLLCGLVAAYPIFAVFDGDESLHKRPQQRILRPLAQMGCKVMARAGDSYAPLAVRGGKLDGFSGELQVASAQVKSSLLLASLGSGQPVAIVEKGQTRDHTEIMLRSLGVPIVSDGLKIDLPEGPHFWDGFSYQVPGDPSSAAFLVAAAVMGENRKVRLEGVCLNPTRMGFFEILKRMGANLVITQTEERMGEPVGVIEASSSKLVATTVEPEEVPRAIDELPLVAVVAAVASGTTVVRGAGELRVKESDRISSIACELSKMGAEIEELEDGFTVSGPCSLVGASLECHYDHRLEMSLAVAALSASGVTELCNSGWASISFPEFWDVYPGIIQQS